MTRLTWVIRVTRMIWVTRMTRMTRVTWVTRMTRVTCVTKMTRVTRVTRVTEVTRMTWVTRVKPWGQKKVAVVERCGRYEEVGGNMTLFLGRATCLLCSVHAYYTS